MAREPKRGCGYRKVGGLYMTSGGLSEHCGRLPVPLHVCPVCNAGIKQTRSWQWVKPAALLQEANTCLATMERCLTCPLSPTNLATIERCGLIWVGEKFYPTAQDFMREAAELGVSRRIPKVPRGFKLGETWVLLAHPKAVKVTPRDEEEVEELRLINVARVKDNLPQQLTLEKPGVITMFKPIALEKIVTETQAQDEAAMEALREKGITPVAVPDDDKDHQGTVYDKDDEPDPQAPLDLGHLETQAQVDAHEAAGIDARIADAAARGEWTP